MTATKTRLHRIISWWLAVFTVITVIMGYAVARRWVSQTALFTRIHMVFEWSFIVLLLFHVIYTIIFVKSRTLYLLRSPGKHWVRLVQHTTKWLILAFSTLVIISGISRYEWTGGAIESWMPFRYHRLFDIFLVLSIIIHLMAGSKIFFNRHKVRNWWINVLILLLGGLLIAGAIYLEVTRSFIY